MTADQALVILKKAGRSMTTTEVAAEARVESRDAYSALAALLKTGQVQKGRAGGAKRPAGDKAVKWRIKPAA